MCPECGGYRGRVVVDVAGKKAARMIRREAKLKTMGVDTEGEKDEGAIANHEDSKRPPQADVEKQAVRKKNSPAMEKAKKTTKKI